MLDATVLGQHRKQRVRDSLAIRLIILPKRDLRTYLPEQGFSPRAGSPRVPPSTANRPPVDRSSIR